jgi:hypothetical protein
MQTGSRLCLHGGTTIKVKTLIGREIEIDTEVTGMVNMIKARVEEEEGILAS